MQQSNNVLKIDLSIPVAKNLVREIAQETCRVIFTKHAEEKMLERNITRIQVIRCLRKGEIVEGPARNVAGNWKLAMRTYSAGNHITVAMALDHDDDGNQIIIITTY